jgi:hypothetical protein
VKTRSAHVIALADRLRITCDLCDSPAVMAEHAPHAGGVSFFHYCGDCWHKPAANGGPSACDRTGAELDDRDDFERRWLAECRAHGDAKRELERLGHGVEPIFVFGDDRRPRFTSLVGDAAWDTTENRKRAFAYVQRTQGELATARAMLANVLALGLPAPVARAIETFLAGSAK